MPRGQGGSQLPTLRIPRVVPAERRTALKWADAEFSLEKADEGFSRISGTTGSGKSHLVKFFLLDVLKEIESNPYAKLILYEPKREFFAWLSSLGLKSKISYFMPSDTAGAALDFTADYPHEKDAETLALAFYPEQPNPHESPFWGDSLRTIYAGVYTAIKGRLGYADLRLMCLVLEDLELTRNVLKFDPYLVQARNLTAVTKKGLSETAQNIQYTVQSRIGKMKVLAAQLDCAARERPLFSLRRFIKEPNSGIFVISKDETYGPWQDSINGVIFLRLTQLLDNEQKDPRRKVFVVIDEFPTLCGDNRCPGVKTMFLRLRSRGAVPLVTDQGYMTLKPLYGEDTAAILGQCTNVIALTQPDDESAQHAARTLGTERGYEKKAGTSFGGEYASININPHWFDRPIVDPSTLRNLFTASEETGIEGWARSALKRDKKPWSFRIDPGEVDLIPETHPDFIEYDERGPETQRLRPLTDEEREALAEESWVRFLD